MFKIIPFLVYVLCYVNYASSIHLNAGDIYKNIETLLEKYQSRQYNQRYPVKYGLASSGYPGNINNNNYNRYPAQPLYNQNGNYQQNPYDYNNGIGNNGNAHYGLAQPQNFNYGPQRPPLFSNGYYGTNSPVQQTYNQGGFSDALNSIAQYDTLRCVPKLLCEMLVGKPKYGNQQSTSFLPSIDLSSILSLLEFGNRQPTPILVFGKAALLGYTSNGDTHACAQAYPGCPRDPDRLVDYLNTHNGGFFRYFNGVQQQPYPQFFPYNQPNIEQRIQTTPTNSVNYFNDPHLYQNDVFRQIPNNKWKFPDRDVENNNYVSGHQPNNYGYNKKGKAVTVFNTNHYLNSVADASQVKVLFPDRTGTGELLLDTNQFLSPQPSYNRHNPFVFPLDNPYQTKIINHRL